MAMAFAKKTNVRLPPEVNRILYVKNLPYKITAEDMYDIFGKYGAIRQIRVGNTPETRGSAFVIYEDIFDAKNACDHLSGFNVCNRYLVVLYYQPNKTYKKLDQNKKAEELDQCGDGPFEQRQFRTTAIEGVKAPEVLDINMPLSVSVAGNAHVFLET